MSVAAVIPNWNGQRFLPDLFGDLRAQSVPFESTIVVDNGSTDGSDRWAEQAGATVVRLAANKGFAVAVNTGVQQSAARHVAVLNSDVRLNRDWLRTMLEGIQDASFAVGKVLRAASPDFIDGTFDSVCRGGTAWRCGSNRPDAPLWSRKLPAVFPPFTAVLLKRQDFLDAGGLDTAFESYLEDVEYGLRAASFGHRGWYLPDAVCTHVGSGTLGPWNARTVRQISRNQVLLIARHYSPELIREYGWRIAVAQVLWGLVALRHGRGLAWLRGKAEGLRAFRRLRCPGSSGTRSLLERSENEIRRLQADAGQDWYWRLYFALT